MTDTQEAPPRGADPAAPPSLATIAEDAFWAARRDGEDLEGAWAAAARAVVAERHKPGSVFSLTTDGLEAVTRQRDEDRARVADLERQLAETLASYRAEIDRLRNERSAGRRALERIADGDPLPVTIAVDALRASGAAQGAGVSGS